MYARSHVPARLRLWTAWRRRRPTLPNRCPRNTGPRYGTWVMHTRTPEDQRLTHINRTRATVEKAKRSAPANAARTLAAGRGARRKRAQGDPRLRRRARDEAGGPAGSSGPVMYIRQCKMNRQELCVRGLVYRASNSTARCAKKQRTTG